MTIQEQILSDLKEVSNLKLLYQILEFIQILKRNIVEPRGNRDRVLQLAGSLSSADAIELQNNINEEFSSIEGDW